MPIERDLRGKRFFITGATGFLGTALVERILRSVPEAEVTVLVRPGRRADAAARLAREVVKNDCFDRLRDELGDRFDDEVASRVQAVAGDVGRDGLGLDDEGRAALAGADVVIHSAATVSFDAPLTQAVEINLLGPSRVAAAVAEVGSGAHLVAVSTAYVASTHQGEAKEELLSENRFTLDVPWEDEVIVGPPPARRPRGRVAQAREAAEFTKKARSEIGAAGEHLIAARAEKVREDWVSDELVKAGTARRSRSAGPTPTPSRRRWASGRSSSSGKARVPITIVRPSIIESALAEPRPGWIRGFRMAEPIIISYAAGPPARIPGVPEGIVDVIPVDLVVAAIIAVAAAGTRARPARVYHVASSVRNPLRYGQLVDLSTDLFQRNPLYDAAASPSWCRSGRSPGRGRVQRQLQAAATVDVRGEAAHCLAGPGQAGGAGRPDRGAALEAERALGYIELYGAYTETDAHFRVDRLLELWDACDDDDQDRFEFDPAPSPGTATSRGPPPLGGRAHAGALLARQFDGGQAARPPAAGHPVARPAPGGLRPRAHARVLQRRRLLRLAGQSAPVALSARASSPTSFARRPRFASIGAIAATSSVFYRRYEDAPIELLREDSWELFHAAPDPVVPRRGRRVRAHRALGHRTLLITGALDFIIEPIRPLFDDIVCAEMGMQRRPADRAPDKLPPHRRGAGPPARRLRREHALWLEESVAYADSASDLAMLEAVGFPVAVNPEARLSAIARRRGWHVEHWAKAQGGSRRPLRSDRST